MTGEKCSNRSMTFNTCMISQKPLFLESMADFIKRKWVLSNEVCLTIDGF